MSSKSRTLCLACAALALGGLTACNALTRPDDIAIAAEPAPARANVAAAAKPSPVAAPPGAARPAAAQQAMPRGGSCGD